MPIKQPNYTQVANDVFDTYMKDFNGSTVKVLLCLFRYIIGYHKANKSDYISLSQIITMTGLNKDTVIKGLQELEETKLIEIKRTSGVINFITLLFEDELSSSRKNPTGVVGKIRQEPVGKSDIPNKLLKKSLNKEEVASKPKPDIFYAFDVILELKPEWLSKDNKILASKTRGVISDLLKRPFEGDYKLLVQFLRIQLGSGRPPDEPTWLINRAWLWYRDRQAKLADDKVAETAENRFLIDRSPGLKAIGDAINTETLEVSNE